jgi:hypothetical protein
MPLNEPQRIELLRILDSELFKTATEEVLAHMDGPVYNLLAPEQGMQLAIEKGARQAFRQLRRLTNPPKPSQTPSRSSQLSHNRTIPQP